MLLRFCIVQVLGDGLNDREIRFVEAAETLEAAKRRIETLAASFRAHDQPAHPDGIDSQDV